MVDIEILSKKLDTYRNKRGRVVNVPDELRLEVLLAWEQWKGKASEFYRALGCSYKGMGAMIGKAKKLRREGHFPTEAFKEVKISDTGAVANSPCTGIEVQISGGKLIRFQAVDQLIDYLKKSEAA